MRWQWGKNEGCFKEFFLVLGCCGGKVRKLSFGRCRLNRGIFTQKRGEKAFHLSLIWRHNIEILLLPIENNFTTKSRFHYIESFLEVIYLEVVSDYWGKVKT